MEALLQVEDLGFGPARRPRLQNVSFALAAGERLAVLGVNGAGKSTLLQLLAGTRAPVTGTVRLRGETLHGGPAALRRHLGYLPQRPPLYPELTARENLEWAGRLRGLRGAALQRAVDAGLRRVGLESVGARLAGRLSGGMAHRLGLAQAVIHAPALLLLDEPTAGLDPLQTEQIRDLLATLAPESALVLATHLLDDVRLLCGRVLVLDDGRTRADQAVTADTDLLAWLRAGGSA
jgi:ABC-2 type transport system ATP-binding protein